MSSALFTPVNIRQTTNVAIVRLKQRGKRFEIACYPSKVVTWRKKIETDLDEVLQTRRVYINVSKGELAKSEDLIKCFDTNDQEKICLLILEKGELQVSQKEREHMLESLLKDVATIIANKCISPDTQKPYPPSVIERALKDIHFAVNPVKSAKQQALEAIRKLTKAQTISISRAQMRLKAIVPSSAAKKLRVTLQSNESTIEKEDFAEATKTMTFTVLVDPGLFREVDEYCTRSGGSVEVVDSVVQQEGERGIEEINVDEKNDEEEQEKNAEGEEEAEPVVSEEEETVTTTKSKKKETKKKGKKGKKAEDDEDEVEAPKKKGKKKAASDDEAEEVATKKKPARKGKKGAVESDEEPAPAPKKGKKVESEEEEEASTMMMKKKGKKKGKKVAAEEEEEQEEVSEAPAPKKKASKKAVSDEEVEEAPVSKKKPAPKKGKKAVDDDDEEEQAPKKKTVASDEEEQEEETATIKKKAAPKKKGKKAKKNEEDDD